MKTQEVLREQLSRAIQNSDRLFGQFLQMLRNPNLTPADRRIGLDLYLEANLRVRKLRSLLGLLIEAEWTANQSEATNPPDQP